VKFGRNPDRGISNCRPQHRSKVPNSHLLLAELKDRSLVCFIPFFLVYFNFLNIDKTNEDMRIWRVSSVKIQICKSFYYCIKTDFSYNFVCICNFFSTWLQYSVYILV